MNIDRFDRTVDLIYDAAMTPALWPDLLRELSGGVGCHFACTVVSSADRRGAEGLAIGISREDHETYLRRFHRDDPCRFGAAVNQGAVDELRLIMPRAALERTELYETSFRPFDLGEGLRLCVRRSGAGQQSISLFRPTSRGPFDAAELHWVRSLMPHLSRASEVGRRLRGAELAAESALAALYQVPYAMLLLDRSGHVRFANAAAETLTREADGLSIVSEGVTSTDRTAATRLSATLARAASINGAAGTLRLPRPSGKPPLVVIAMPLRARALDALLLPDEPAILLCVSDPAAHRPAPQTLWTELFGLTRAEADVAARLLGGMDVRAIAKDSDRSVNTVRNLLARLMAKTETTRQSELIRLLGGLPTMSAPF